MNGLKGTASFELLKPILPALLKRYPFFYTFKINLLHSSLEHLIAIGQLKH